MADQPTFDEYLSYPIQGYSVPALGHWLHDDSSMLEASASETLPIVPHLAFTQSYMPHWFDPSSTPYPSQLHNEQLLSDSQHIPITAMDPSTTTMGPPTNPRKRKAPTLRAEDWEPYKARIIELHIDDGLPLREVKDIIDRESESKFKAEYVFPNVRSERQPSTVILILTSQGSGNIERASASGA